MLILFDIDGTLLLTRGAGISAMEDAGREMFGDHFSMEGLSTAGRLDGLIWADAAAANGVDDADAHHPRFRQMYGDHLRRRLDNGQRAEPLPGTHALIESLAARDELTLGLLTGNYPETGMFKVERATFEPAPFVVNAWGVDGNHRRDLPPVAMQRFAERNGRTIDPKDVLIIGDTPHDVDCAHHNGCRCLAVCTGAFDADQLREAGADMVVPTLEDTAAISNWIARSV